MQFVPFISLNVLDPIKIYFFKGATTETFPLMQENSFLLVGLIGNIYDNDSSGFDDDINCPGTLMTKMTVELIQ